MIEGKVIQLTHNDLNVKEMSHFYSMGLNKKLNVAKKNVGLFEYSWLILNS